MTFFHILTGGAHQDRARHSLLRPPPLHRSAQLRVSEQGKALHGHGLRSGDD